MRGPGNKPSRTIDLWEEDQQSTEGVILETNYTGVFMRFIALSLLLAGCSTSSYQPGDKTFTISHGTMMFNSAMGQARRNCEEMGMAVRHLGTHETGFQPVSRFECVPK
jgi:hypothetical protein